MNGTKDYILLKGSVVTVEPGLYYPGLGGCRIEDVVQVTSGGAKTSLVLSISVGIVKFAGSGGRRCLRQSLAEEGRSAAAGAANS